MPSSSSAVISPHPYLKSATEPNRCGSFLLVIVRAPHKVNPRVNFLLSVTCVVRYIAVIFRSFELYLNWSVTTEFNTFNTYNDLLMINKSNFFSSCSPYRLVLRTKQEIFNSFSSYFAHTYC